jgi:23S rRNA (pseudouridine1915-N3)-methyltransferase
VFHHIPIFSFSIFSKITLHFAENAFRLACFLKYTLAWAWHAFMKIHLLAVGRAKSSPETHLFDQYIKRLSWPFQLHEVEEKKPLPPEKLKDKEAALLLQACPKGAVLIALDERGKTMSSPDFAALIGGMQGETQTLAFAIGGAHGHGQALRQQARHIISFGKMTFPHMLVRTLVAEQIYRAKTILDGHPYHKI